MWLLLTPPTLWPLVAIVITVGNGVVWRKVQRCYFPGLYCTKNATLSFLPCGCYYCCGLTAHSRAERSGCHYFLQCHAIMQIRIKLCFDMYICMYICMHDSMRHSISCCVGKLLAAKSENMATKH